MEMDVGNGSTIFCIDWKQKWGKILASGELASCSDLKWDRDSDGTSCLASHVISSLTKYKDHCWNYQDHVALYKHQTNRRGEQGGVKWCTHREVRRRWHTEPMGRWWPQWQLATWHSRGRWQWKMVVLELEARDGRGRQLCKIWHNDMTRVDGHFGYCLFWPKLQEKRKY